MANVGEPTYATDVNQFGAVAYGSRSSIAGPTSGATELGILRLDNLNLTAGYFYLVLVGNLRVDMSVVTDRAKFILRYNSAGTATTSSTALARSERAIPTSGDDLNSFPKPMGWIIPGSSTTTGSVLLSMSRPSGTGTLTAPPSPYASDELVTMAILNFGPAPADTGVAV